MIEDKREEKRGVWMDERFLICLTWRTFTATDDFLEILITLSVM